MKALLPIAARSSSRWLAKRKEQGRDQGVAAAIAHHANTSNDSITRPFDESVYLRISPAF
jgi:hypothetical protein